MRLIRDVTRDLGVNAEGVSVILHLIDQVHGLRSALGEYVKSTTQRHAAIQIPMWGVSEGLRFATR